MAYVETRIGRLIKRWPDLARRRLLEALRHTGGNVEWASDRMGVDAATVRRWLIKLDDDGKLRKALDEMRRCKNWKKRRRRPRGYAEVG